MHKNPIKQTQKRSLSTHPFTRRDFLATSMKAGAAAFTTGLLPNRQVSAQGQYNVLFIVVDNLRPFLECYGDPEVHTPNIEIHIYNLKGETVRQLLLGFQDAGTYRSQSRAAYWDGRNAVGEPVASGIYFYTLQAGPFKATRRMIIMK